MAVKEKTLRKAISTKTRFDIFKRDGFVCQYCGEHPPAVILHVDHITAVADGGGNDLDNLVTSCAPCNMGKGARPLSDIPMSLADKARETAEREAQIQGYHDVMEARRQRLEDSAWDVAEVYMSRYGQKNIYRGEFQSIKLFVDQLGFHAVLDAMEMAVGRKNVQKWGFKYFCGICWNRIRGFNGSR